ncbi:Predicted DNA-binding protein, UPF0251 family [Selenomonas ruminantium]|uniref:Predicted DNA-binding protein, UPF0251 family n=1 Tax=Selenomonas ruminantium TaxID=971 RepID=A0A1M6X9G2_SELRU|nr:DUF134 domain-containing protein [Selenomonas ruminantium]SHL02601.1 Predicted DNA-binding protein, UPF0251 family [Selenomonas ruminantium]
MSRPTKLKRIHALPAVSRFIPEAAGDNPPVAITIEEYECIRLMDYEGMTQEECARVMGVARTTVQALYVAARKRIAGCLVEARPLVITGGSFELCKACSSHAPFRRLVKEGSEHTMKLAVTYENGQIFQHFGHTSQFKVYTIEEGVIQESHVLSSNGAGHGALATLLQEADIDTLICGGIGAGAQNALANAGIALYGGVQGDADTAVHAFLDGKLAYDPAVRCNHHDHGEGHTCGSHGCGGHGHGHGGCH